MSRIRSLCFQVPVQPFNSFLTSNSPELSGRGRPNSLLCPSRHPPAAGAAVGWPGRHYLPTFQSVWRVVRLMLCSAGSEWAPSIGRDGRPGTDRSRPRHMTGFIIWSEWDRPPERASNCLNLNGLAGRGKLWTTDTERFGPYTSRVEGAALWDGKFALRYGGVGPLGRQGSLSITMTLILVR